MGKVICLVIINFLYTYVNGQSIYQKIESTFQQIDSVTYINKALLKDCCATFYSEKNREWCYQQIEDRVVNVKAIFLLNIDIDSTLIHTNNYIQLDHEEYNFTLLFVDKKTRLKNKICFLNNEIYPFFVEFTGSIYGKKFEQGYKKVIKTNPRYILWCFRLSFTILYIPDEPEERILVYNIWDEKTYELAEYLDKIKNKKESDPDSYRYEYKVGTFEEIGAW
ncbi:hypothetical protein LJB92_04540 [Bacteroidales bacterium OttesenSCG-928-M06]|nr:hypothetical protein [Bacteroidales bacterium OttesenSCG-928-M06]